MGPAAAPRPRRLPRAERLVPRCAICVFSFWPFADRRKPTENARAPGVFEKLGLTSVLRICPDEREIPYREHRAERDTKALTALLAHVHFERIEVYRFWAPGGLSILRAAMLGVQLMGLPVKVDLDTARPLVKIPDTARVNGDHGFSHAGKCVACGENKEFYDMVRSEKLAVEGEAPTEHEPQINHLDFTVTQAIADALADTVSIHDHGERLVTSLRVLDGGARTSLELAGALVDRASSRGLYANSGPGEHTFDFWAPGVRSHQAENESWRARALASRVSLEGLTGLRRLELSFTMSTLLLPVLPPTLRDLRLRPENDMDDDQCIMTYGRRSCAEKCKVKNALVELLAPAAASLERVVVEIDNNFDVTSKLLVCPRGERETPAYPRLEVLSIRDSRYMQHGDSNTSLVKSNWEDLGKNAPNLRALECLSLFTASAGVKDTEEDDDEDHDFGPDKATMPLLLSSFFGHPKLEFVACPTRRIDVARAIELASRSIEAGGSLRALDLTARNFRSGYGTIFESMNGIIGDQSDEVGDEEDSEPDVFDLRTLEPLLHMHPLPDGFKVLMGLRKIVVERKGASVTLKITKHADNDRDRPDASDPWHLPRVAPRPDGW